MSLLVLRIYNIASLLGIAPFFDFAKKSLSNPIRYKIYTICLALISTIGTSLSVGKRSEFNHLPLPSNVFLDYTSEAAILIVFLTTLLGSSFWNSNNWQRFNTAFLYLQQTLPDDATSKTTIKFILSFQLIVGHLGYVFGIFFQIYLWKCKIGTGAYLTYIFCNFHQYYLFFTTILTTFFLRSFRQKYKNLANLITSLKNSRIKFLEGISRVWRLYRLLAETVELFNQIFGWFMAIATFHCVIKILACLNIAMNGEAWDKEVQPYVVFAYLISSWLILMAVISITFNSDLVSKEAENLSEVCYALQENFKSQSEERKELLELAKRIADKIPKCTAAGFFVLNRSTFIRVMGATTSYIIVIIQFNRDVTARFLKADNQSDAYKNQSF